MQNKANIIIQKQGVICGENEGMKMLLKSRTRPEGKIVHVLAWVYVLKNIDHEEGLLISANDDYRS